MIQQLGKTVLPCLYLIAWSLSCVFISCSTDIAGNSAETGNAKVLGSIVDSAGVPVAKAEVCLLSQTYNPVTDQPLQNSFIDTTDNNGRYSFTLSDTGTYNIQAVHLSLRTRLIIMGISIKQDTVFVPEDTLEYAGTIKLFLPDTIDTATGYLYFRGTTLYRYLSEAMVVNDSTYTIAFPSVPAMYNQTIHYGRRNIPDYFTPFRDSIFVLPNDTTILDFLRWTNYTSENTELLGNRVNHICNDMLTSTLWIATERGVSGFHLLNKTWTNYTRANSRLPSDRVNAIAVSKEVNPALRATWFATDSGAASLVNSQWTLLNKENSELPSNHITDIAIDSTDGIWFSTGDGGVAHLSNTVMTVYTTGNGLPSNVVLQLSTDSSGRIWCATNSGAARFAYGQWEPFTTVNSDIYSNEVYSVACDNNANVWFGCRDGVSRFYGSTWTSYTAQSSSPVLTDTVFTILFDNQDNVLIGTSAGLTRFNGKEWFDFSGGRYALLAQKQVRACAIDVMRNTWAGTGNHGVIGFGFTIKEE